MWQHRCWKVLTVWTRSPSTIITANSTLFSIVVVSPWQTWPLKATQVIFSSGSQTLLFLWHFLVKTCLILPDSYKQRWWLLRGTQVLVSGLLLWCWADDYWSFFDHCCGVHPSHALLRLGLPLPFQPEVTCFVHPPLHKHGKEQPVSRIYWDQRWCDGVTSTQSLIEQRWFVLLSHFPYNRCHQYDWSLENNSNLLWLWQYFIVEQFTYIFVCFLSKQKVSNIASGKQGVAPSCSTVGSSSSHCKTRLQTLSTRVVQRDISLKVTGCYKLLSSCLFVCAPGLRGSRIISYPTNEKDNHQPGLSATSHAEDAT